MKGVFTRSLLKSLLIISCVLLMIILYKEGESIAFNRRWNRELREKQARGYSSVTRGDYANQDTTKVIIK